MTVGFLGFSWLAWGGLCLVVAAFYAVIWPKPRKPEVARRQRLVLRWAHAGVWFCMATSFFIRTWEGPGSTVLANAVALSALAVYAIFLGVTFSDRRTRP